MTRKFVLDEMTWKEAEEAFKRTNIVIIPLGATHQHGLAVPLGADHILAFEVSKRIAEKCDVIVAPIIPFGNTVHHMDFPGCISVSNDTLKAIILEICECLYKWGARKIIFNTGHGGWRLVLPEIAQILRRDYGLLCAQFDWYTQLEKGGFEWYEYGRGEGMIQEIAGMLAVRPDIVRLDALEKWKEYKSLSDTLITASPESVRFGKSNVTVYFRYGDVTETGHAGSPETRDYSKATAELGKRMISEVVDYMVMFVEELKKVKIPLVGKS